MLFEPSSLATIGAALALMGGLIGSSIGIGIAGSAGAATLSEDSSQFRNVIILASLPMTQTFYGFIVLILIMSVIGGDTWATIINDVGSGAGAMYLGIGLIAAGAECFSAIYQGHVCASGISLLPKTKGKILTNAVMLAVFVELLGVLGFVFAIVSMSLLKIM